MDRTSSFPSANHYPGDSPIDEPALEKENLLDLHSEYGESVYNSEHTYAIVATFLASHYSIGLPSGQAETSMATRYTSS